MDLPENELLEKVLKAGFKPIGFTTMICEETFIFKGIDEAKRAWEVFKPQGWWYGFGDFIEARKEYVKEAYDNNEDFAPIIYWLDKNFAPKNER